MAGKGLVVVSGCSHAGAVNVLHNARRLTGRDRIVGFVGGFHLTGAVFEPIIEPTVAAFAEFGVERLVPGHCTGWKGTHRLAQAMPDASVQPSVGTTVRFDRQGRAGRRAARTRTSAPAAPASSEASSRPSFTGAWKPPSGKARSATNSGTVKPIPATVATPASWAQLVPRAGRPAPGVRPARRRR